MVNISLTEEEYEKLRVLATVGEWVINARADVEDETYTDLREKILTVEDDASWNDNGEPSDEKMLELLGDYITPYDEKAMIDLFADKLAMINLMETHGEALETMEEDAFLELYDEEKRKVTIEVFGEEHHRM